MRLKEMERKIETESYGGREEEGEREGDIESMRGRVTKR